METIQRKVVFQLKSNLFVLKDYTNELMKLFSITFLFCLYFIELVRIQAVMEPVMSMASSNSTKCKLFTLHT